MLEVILERPEDAKPIETLLDHVFGIGRFSKASYRFRRNIEPVKDLSWVAIEDEKLAGTIRYWPVLVGPEKHKALLLGPLGVVPERSGQGIGRALVYRSIERAIELGHDLVFLVGDPPYYQRFGFQEASKLGFVMPGEGQPHRLQCMALRDNILGKVQGDIQPVQV